MYKTMFKAGIVGLVASLLLTVPVSAHVVVRPADVKTASFLTFTASVPNEKDIPTTELKVLIPESLTHVSPTVKPGWEIITETADGADGGGHGNTAVRAITWRGGEIPEGQRDDFTFSAKTPDNDGELQWKAYQTYADGTIVAWDRTEGDQPTNEDGSPDFSTAGPMSVTSVASSEADQSDTVAAAGSDSSETTTARRALYVSIAAVIVALISLVIATKPKK